MRRKQNFLTVVTLLALSVWVTACGGGAVVEKIVTVEVEKVVTVEVEKEVEKIVTVEVEAEVEEAEAEEAAAEEPTEAPAEEEAAAEPTEAPAETEEETAAPAAQGANTLQVVQDRGRLICGGNADVPGFGYLNPDTNAYEGFDIDFCRAIAAAIFGDSTQMEVRNTTSTDRFPVLQSGEVDLLIRNTTWTISRDTSLGFNFAPTTFYDGQGMMVRKESGIASLEDLEGGTVCVGQGTTTEKNLADVMRAMEINYEAVVIAETTNEALFAYDEGRCDGYTTDKSGLIALQTITQDPTEHVILEETMSKEPLGPLVRHGDDQWFDIVKWVTYGLFQAEELGITSENVEDIAATSEDPVVRNLLGAEGELGQGLGLENDFMVKAILEVGNYGEIYDRNLGPDTVFNVPRGGNALWTDGGLIYSPPFR
jgi:general L-amino acid transport system substrate-binding protein